jgi:signal transduction histidine kinase
LTVTSIERKLNKLKQLLTPEPSSSDSNAVVSPVGDPTAVGRLASRLSDELRQPLALIRNALYFLDIRLGTDLDEKARRHITFLNRGLLEMDGIVENLSALAGTDVADRQATDAQALVATALERAQIRPDVTIEAAVESGKVLFCDSFQIRLALLNVINNSIQALPGAGRVRIVCQVVGQQTRIVISDNGPGMTEEVRARVFEPFFTTSSQRVGIGLTAAQRLVGSSGGTIMVESTPGAGTTVTLSFPRHERPRTEQAKHLDDTAGQTGEGRMQHSERSEEPSAPKTPHRAAKRNRPRRGCRVQGTVSYRTTETRGGK